MNMIEDSNNLTSSFILFMKMFNKFIFTFKSFI